MRFERRRDLDNEATRTYYPGTTWEYVVNNPVAVYTTPGLNFEGVLDTHGNLHLVPSQELTPCKVSLLPGTDEPLEL